MQPPHLLRRTPRAKILVAAATGTLAAAAVAAPVAAAPLPAPLPAPALATSPAPATAPAPVPTAPDSPSPGPDRIDPAGVGGDQGAYRRFIVKYRDPAVAKGRTGAAAAKVGVRATVGRRLGTGASLVTTATTLSPQRSRAFLAALRADRAVQYAEPDRLLTKADVPTDPGFVTRQWHYRGPGAGERAGAHLPDTWNIGATAGNGAIVAVLDTGITYHPDLSPNVLPGYDFVSDPFTANDGGGRDFNPADPGDSCDGPSSWHGTHVAGTIAAVRNGAGVVGVAYGARVRPVRVLGRCGGYLSDIADAVIWASGGSVPGVPGTARAAAINMSLGGYGPCDYTMQTAINGAVGRGTTVVVAAGNENDRVGNYVPASCNNVITVAALTRANNRAYYSNYGYLVDIAAPGGNADGDPRNDVFSTLNTGTTSPGSPTYTAYAGTSMATPHVAGVAAILQGYRRALGRAQLAPADVTRLITQGARPNTCIPICGSGTLDAYNTVRASQSIP